MYDTIRIQISAFVDGELPENEAELLLRRMSQDAELRQQAASYLEIGRLLRGEPALARIAGLRERIAAEVDEKPSPNAEVDEHSLRRRRWLRPVAGIAIAASVALIGIMTLRQTAVDDNVHTVAPSLAADTAVADSYTVPAQDNDRLRQYLLSHGATSSNLGANGINARLTALQLRQDEIKAGQLPQSVDKSVDKSAEKPGNTPDDKDAANAPNDKDAANAPGARERSDVNPDQDGAQ